jgi:hypothetical protein
MDFLDEYSKVNLLNFATVSGDGDKPVLIKMHFDLINCLSYFCSTYFKATYFVIGAKLFNNNLCIYTVMHYIFYPET